MEKNALIIGYGSAGKRHAKLLISEGFGIITYDPDPAKDATISNLDVLFERFINQQYNFVVIATPPDTHWPWIRCCLAFNHKIVCEKPLFGFGTLSCLKDFQPSEKEIYSNPYVHNLEHVAVTYNYRYHPTLLHALQEKENAEMLRNWWYMECGQYRVNPPSWGYLLDHISHDIDILLWMSNVNYMDVAITKATSKESHYHKQINVSGQLGNQNFEILDIVYKSPVNRFADINTPWGFYSIDANPSMFINMWRSIIHSFDNGFIPEPNFFKALKTQNILEAIHKEISNGANNE